MYTETIINASILLINKWSYSLFSLIKFFYMHSSGHIFLLHIAFRVPYRSYLTGNMN